jgi:hypothetical protein
MQVLEKFHKLNFYIKFILLPVVFTINFNFYLLPEEAYNGIKKMI